MTGSFEYHREFTRIYEMLAASAVALLSSGTYSKGPAKRTVRELYIIKFSLINVSAGLLYSKM